MATIYPHAPTRALLSPNQQALYTLYRLAPDTPAYHLAFAADFPDCCPQRLAAALCALVRHHASLRTSFDLVDDQPVQAVLPARSFVPEMHDASLWSQDQIDTLLDERANQPFDLTQGACRAVVLQRRNGAVLLLVIHHLTADFWTMQRLTNDLGALYTSPDQPLPATAAYCDHVTAQTAWLASEEAGRLRAWWAEHLRQELPPLDLPTDHPRPPRQRFEGRTHVFEISAEINARLHQRTRAAGQTPFQLLLAAWGLLLSRHSGRQRVVVGTPDNGRKDRAFRGTAGYFANPLPLILEPRATLFFNDYLQQTVQRVHHVLAHRRMPFQAIIDLAQIERDPSRAPLFQTMLAYLNVRRMPGLADFALHRGGGELEANGLRCITRDLNMAGAQMDVVLHAYDGGAQRPLVLGIEYDTHLFDHSTIQRMERRFVILLQALSQGVDMPLNHFHLATEEEARVMHHHETCRIPECGIHELFTRQVRQTPDQTALVHEGQAIS